MNEWEKILKDGENLFNECKYEELEKFLKKIFIKFSNEYGENSNPIIATLNMMSGLYLSKKNYKKAYDSITKALNICKVIPYDEKNNLLYAEAFNCLGSFYAYTNDYNKAEEPLLKALSMIEKSTSEEKYSYYIPTLNTLASLYCFLEEYLKAKKIYIKCLKVLKKYEGEDSNLHYLIIVSNLFVVYLKLGDKKRYIKYLHKSLKVGKKIEPKGHHNIYINVLNSVGLHYRESGNYDKAEKYFRKALKNIIEPETMRENICNNIAVLYMDKGDYKKSEKYIIKSVKLSKKLEPKGKNIKYVSALNTIALLYKKMGNYKDAVKINKKVIKISKDIEPKGKNHTYILAIINLAYLNTLIGNLEKAENLYKHSFEITKSYDPVGYNPKYFYVINYLAPILIKRKKYKEAEAILIESINKNTDNKDNPVYLNSLLSLALLYKETKNYSRSKNLYEEVIDIYKKNNNTKSPDFEKVLRYYSKLLRIINSKEKSKIIIEEALNISKNFEPIGKNPEYKKCLSDLSILEMINNEKEASINHLIQCSEINDGLISNLLYAGAEKTMLTFIKNIESNYFKLLSALYYNYNELKRYTKDVYNVVLKRKSIVQEIVSLRNKNIQSSNDNNILDKYNELISMKSELVTLTYQETDLNDNKRYEYIIDRIEELEEELVSKIPNVMLESNILNINPNIITKLIPNKTILIEYVWFTPYNFFESKFEKPVYIAFILDKNKQVNMIDLGKAEIIDDAIKTYRKSISRIVDLEKYQTVSRGMVEYVAEKVESDVYNDFYTNSKKLFKLLVEPLSSHINNIKKYIISTDSNISLITFETLIDNSDKYLIEDNDISYIDTGRDITRFSDDFYKNTANLSKVIVADPDYDFREDIINKTNSPKISEKHARVRDVIKDKIIHFDDLKETKFEGEFLKNLLGEDVELLMGKDCLESSLKKLKSPKLLHLATHGFFLDFETKEQTNEFEYELDKYYSSLLNSGIALAGANSFLKGNKLPQEAEDGLLTSFDVTGLNLAGTNLVVLSACDTGVGEVLNGEGVYGLRRAFIISGVKSLVVSLWKVFDKETRDFILEFYKKMINGLDKASALRETQRELIIKNKQGDKLPFPHDWGGSFIYIGEPVGKFV